MAAYESGENPPLQGVSQQIARERLPGQCTAQDNMLSDPVTNLRRRPGAEYVYSKTSTGATKDNTLAWFVDIAGVSVHVLLHTGTGHLTILDTDYAVLDDTLTSTYLIGARTDIRAAVVGDELYLLNKSELPAAVAPVSPKDPDIRGMFYVVAGAFNKEYSVTITTSASSYIAKYKTPDGTGVNDAANSSPAAISKALRDLIFAQAGPLGLATVDNTDAYTYLQCSGGTTALRVESGLGNLYLTVSKDSYVTGEAQLPALLPTSADGYIIRVGDTKLPKYYKYVSATATWLESGRFDSPTGISNMPVSLTQSGGVWSLDTSVFEGRLAGDTESNPDPRFLEHGISGMGTFQGRLALLSGPQVSLSASAKPRRFFRSTVAQILDSDPIHVGSNANSSAAYNYAIPFQKDLLLFSEKYQALLPSGNVAITPRTATVLVTSGYTADMTGSPVPIGRTLVYPAPRGKDFFGVMEMLPSADTDAQYISSEATLHLPKYMAGRCRFGVASTTANLAVFGQTSDTKALIVHEYQWEGDKKVQQAWHRWVFQYDVADAYFAGDALHILFAQNNTLVLCTIDPDAGVLTANAERRPFLDLYSPLDVVANEAALPAWLLAFDPSIGTKLRAVERAGALAGSLVGSSVVAGDLVTALSYPEVDVYVGVPYTSTFSPTTPMHRDRNGAVVGTSKATLLRYIITTFNSTEYTVAVVDPRGTDTVDAATLFFSSSELVLGESLVGDLAVANVPCRTRVDETILVVSTDGTGDLNIVALDHVLKVQEKIRRRTV